MKVEKKVVMRVGLLGNPSAEWLVSMKAEHLVATTAVTKAATKVERKVGLWAVKMADDSVEQKVDLSVEKTALSWVASWG